MVFYSLLISSALIGYALAQGCSSNAPWTDADRQAWVEQHNQKRASLIQGNERTAYGYNAPKGKNMYKVEYDCELEALAQGWASNCKWGHNPAIKEMRIGENMAQAFLDDSTDAAVTSSNEMWWKELLTHGGASLSSTAYGIAPGSGHFTQMAWAKSVKIGCGIATCPNINYKVVVCNYKDAGNYPGDVYEICKAGEAGCGGCQQDSHCTTLAESKCDTSSGLCYGGDASKTCADDPMLKSSCAAYGSMCYDACSKNPSSCLPGGSNTGMIDFAKGCPVTCGMCEALAGGSTGGSTGGSAGGTATCVDNYPTDCPKYMFACDQAGWWPNCMKSCGKC